MRFLIRSAIALALLTLPAAAFCQDVSEGVTEGLGGSAESAWRAVASPSYGLLFFHGRIRSGGLGEVTNTLKSEGFFASAADLRFFLGREISGRNGFYSGLETGVVAFLPGPTNAKFTDAVSVYDANASPNVWSGTYEFKVRYEGAFVFLAARYGYRFETGTSLYGWSFGVDLGLGAGVYDGGVRLYIGDKDDSMTDIDYGKDGSVLSMIADCAFEASLKLGKYFSVVGKLGIVYLPINFPGRDMDGVDRHTMTDGSLYNSPEEYMRYALYNYTVDLDAFAYGVRFGFALRFM